MTDLEYQALLLSVKVGFYTVLWLLPFAIFLAWLLARKQFFGKTLLDSMIHLPLVLPPVVVGYILLVLMGRQGLLGAPLHQLLDISFSFNWKGVVLACWVVSLPLMVRAIRLSLESVDIKLEQAAATLGASPLKVFFTITLPLMTPGLITGITLAFARSLGEFGATISFVSNIPGETQTLPLAMFNFIETPGAEMQAARLCILSIVIALLSLFISEWLNRRAAARLGVKI
ncbi:molybdate ABC transporter permease subunit [Vibrio cidicii]|uniref:molybdate ABC transporter permease subunit n=1 Tax=Vibrio cidicii TaxID=1763883 RepID=UPI0018C31DAF|nr:molybdate ABC transporter permease subunit [Vibrio cidicii]MBG0756283.1 molybdate ABC transporter permease [Vibrio cidicii]